jgi:hypothetical protein
MDAVEIYSGAAAQTVLVLIPVDVPEPIFMQRFMRFSITEAIKYHSLTVHVEDPEALIPGKPYVIGACGYHELPF